MSGEGFFYFPPKEEIISDFRLLVTTLISAGRFFSMGIEQSHFTHIFIDEAGHGMEPECLVAISGLLGTDEDRGQLVLAGDPKQLGPVLRSPVAIKHGLGTSLLERLMSSQFPCFNRRPASNTYDSRMVTKLLNNYRSHPAIIKLPNEMFYENELRACADELLRSSLCQWDGLKKRGFPVIFEAVYGKDQREERSPSFFNPQEVSVVLRYVKDLKNARGVEVKTPDIGIISPYHKQVQKIRQGLQKKPYNIRDIKVGSVEEFQGQERKVIIISTVRSSEEFLQLDATHKLGFLKNPKRFNVAITRAKALLIVIGNPHVLCRDEHWRKFIQYCLDNGSFGNGSAASGFGGGSGSCSFQMPEAADETLVSQLNKLRLNENEALKNEEDLTRNDYEDPEWRPEEH